MATTSQDRFSEPYLANRNAFILLRWLLIVLTGYLTVFSDLEEGISGIAFVAVAFVLSNVLIELMPLQLLLAAKKKHIIMAIDAVFIAIFLNYLRIDEAQIHLPFIGVVVLAIIWPDMRVVLFAVFVVSLLFGMLSNFQVFDTDIDLIPDDFLTLSLLFVISILYIFMVDRFDRNSETSAALLREKHNSENITEITRKLSASLKANEILTILIKELREMMPEVDCSVVRVDARTGDGQVVACSQPDGAKAISLDQFLALNEALVAKETSAVTLRQNSSNSNERPLKTVAVPMISRDEIVALLYFEHTQNAVELLDSDVGHIEIVAATAANALSNAEQFEKLQNLATSDSMTKLANHAAFQTKLNHEVERARRHNRNVCLLMIDIDHLKLINDQHGHPVGDQVIGAVADSLRATCREIDFAARYGGEEFAVILPETDLKSGILVAERLRKHIADFKRLETQLTVSIGIANCPLDASSTEELIQAADNALYAAKGAGRNRVSPTVEEV